MVIDLNLYWRELTLEYLILDDRDGRKSYKKRDNRENSNYKRRRPMLTKSGRVIKGRGVFVSFILSAICFYLKK